ncbi:hypothetical protein GIB67_033848, partial [Kingdonia uniflora]
MSHPTMMYARESSVVVENIVDMPGIGKRWKDVIPDDIVEVKQDELMKNKSKEDHAFGPSYQTRIGKTYTMWGSPSAILEDHSPSSNHDIVPRIFQMLFSEFQREQEKSEETNINYQCRYSFLEVYNEQIGDLLGPTQRNLQGTLSNCFSSSKTNRITLVDLAGGMEGNKVDDASRQCIKESKSVNKSLAQPR